MRDWTYNINKMSICTTIQTTNEPQHEISNNMVHVTGKGSDQAVHTHSLIRAFASRLNFLGLLGYWPNIILSF